jgi:hypothetical protein
MRVAAILSSAAVIAAAVAGYCWLGPCTPALAPALPAAEAAPEPSPPAAPQELAARPLGELADAAGVDPRATVRLPDGSRVRSLNGVLDAPELIWTPGRTYSEIVGVVTRAGVDWFVHADDTMSTTVMVLRKDLGKEVPLTMVSRPREVFPSRTAASDPAHAIQLER